MDEVRPPFVWFMVVVVTVIFAILYTSLPPQVQAVDTRRHRSPLFGEPTFGDRQVDQRPLLVGVWLVIVVPLAGWGVFLAVRGFRDH